MSITKELRTLVICALCVMPDSDFRKMIKASFDGRRVPQQKKTPSVKKPGKKLHWKTAEKMWRGKKESNKKTTKKRTHHNQPSGNGK